MPPNSSTNLFQMLCAALTDICCPTIDLASEKNASFLGSKCSEAQHLMMADSTGSAPIRWRRAASQNGGRDEGLTVLDGDILDVGAGIGLVDRVSTER